MEAITESKPVARARRSRFSYGVCAAAVAGIVMVSGGVAAQSTGNVAVDLSVLDTPAPAPSNRIVLQPPPGVKPVSPRSGSTVKLRPPQSAAAARAPAAPKPAPAPVAAAPSPPATAPATPITPPAPAPAAASATPPEAPPPTLARTTVNRTQEPRDPMAANAPGAPSSTVANIEAATDTPPRPAAPSAPAMTTPMVNPAPSGPVGPVANPLPAAAAAAAETQTAALPNPATEATSEAAGETMTIGFSAGVSDLSADNSASLRGLAEKMAGNPSLRVQLLAYASDPEKNASRSRRLSLARALAVRTYLIDAGIDSTRIEVRALGDQSESGEPDRVDALVAQR